METTTNLYQKRLNIINNTDNRTVMDSIDRPIRNLVIELHRIGFKTKFSCCGFSYDNEEEPKTHAKKPFVVLHPIEKEQYKLFFNFCTQLSSVGWSIVPYGNNGEWHLHSDLITGNDNFYNRQKDIIGIHDYELNLVRIYSLYKLLLNFETKNITSIIRDGNGYYDMLDEEWQIKPKKSVVITFNNQGEVYE